MSLSVPVRKLEATKSSKISLPYVENLKAKKIELHLVKQLEL
jgi:hypothetical protein